MLNKELNVEISPDKKYPIFINNDNIENLEKEIYKYTNANKILLVISEKVNKLYGEKLNFKNSVKFVLKDGEKEKNFKNFEKIQKFALKNRLERKDAIIAIGGGVVGDITGFVAATYLRGIDFIQIPTTLLACVDSSVGGKVAINTDYGKNLIGAFYQPKVVFCNLNFLKTLDERQFKTGLAEVVKYAFISANCIDNNNFFDFLDTNSDKILARDEEVLSQVIETSLKLKASVVSQDEKEQNLRRILNFGHTYGHAVEKITNYKKYTHGEAVAIGMIFAINLAYEKRLITQEYKEEGLKLINKFNLFSGLSHRVKALLATAQERSLHDIKKLVELMKSDKKVEDGKINFILPSQKCKVEILDIKPEEI